MSGLKEIKILKDTEMSTPINIIDLIEKNPITSLHGDYHSKILSKIQREFTQTEQYMFVGSFYCYLNYHPTDDFVIQLKDVWKWLGFARQDPCKVVLEKHFIENVDYKIEKFNEVNVHASATSGARLGDHGGQNKEKITMNVETFKKLCMKSNTKKADEIHDYFIKLEKIIMETLNEESSELRMQLAAQDTRTELRIKSKEAKIIDQFPDDIMCIYIADVGIHNGVRLVKFGESNKLKDRVSSHRITFKESGFELIAAYRVVNSKKFENLLKQEIVCRKSSLKIGDKNYTELIKLDDDFTIESLDILIKKLINKHCSMEAIEREYDFKKLELQEKNKQEEEKTKQDEIELKKIEIQEKTRQIEIQEKTKQDEIQLKRLEIEIRLLELKFQQNNPTTSIPVQIQPQQQTQVQRQPRQSKASTTDEEKVVEYVEKFTKYSTNTKDHIIVDEMYKDFIAYFYDENTSEKPLKESTFRKFLYQIPGIHPDRFQTGVHPTGSKIRIVVIRNRIKA
jgi:hypothetical protein